jgi:two-component system sensor histidine kinase KdpD
MTDRITDRDHGSPTIRAYAGQGRRRLAVGYLAAILGTALLIVAFMPSRDDVTPLSHGFAFMALVVFTVMVGGLWPGVLAALLGFFAMNYFFLPPYGTLRLARGEYVVVLLSFLALAVLIAALLARARARAEAAEQRASELQTQQELARALVDPGRGGERYEVVLRMIVSRFRFREVELLITPRADLGGLQREVVVGAPGSELEPPLGPAEERVALNLDRRNLGVLVLRGSRPPLDPSERRIVNAFADQLTLVLERDRLLREAVARSAPEAQSPSST